MSHLMPKNIDAFNVPRILMKEVLDSPWYKLIFKLQTTIIRATYDFFNNKRYEPVVLPITTGSVTSPMALGSDSLPVKIDLFGEPTYLADSMQFHLEYLLRISQKGVFYIMPTFRGENPGARHLNQFFHIEAEIKGKLDDMLSLIDEYVYFMLSKIIEFHEQELKTQIKNIDHLLAFISRKEKPFERITFIEAVNLLNKQNPHFFQYLDKIIIGLSHAGERELMKIFEGEVCVTHLPRVGVPFYQANAEDGQYALCADYLAGIGEFIGCGQRHLSYTETLNAIKEKGVNPEEYDWYLQMKKEFALQTSGFGLGMERFLLWILNHNDIRNIPIISRLKGDLCHP